ncbi:MAG: lipid A deacylase LpxR family protein [Leadbetterella sp.]|nr:lipid A deacylase LpxR family protein [Leadbetterella sp.]
MDNPGDAEKYVYLFLSFLFCFSPLCIYAQEQKAQGTEREEINIPVNYDPIIKTLSIGTQNDVLFHTDQDFTTELDVFIITNLWRVKIPLLMGFDKKPNSYTLKPGIVSETRNFQKIGVLLGYYTPEKHLLKIDRPLHFTRPYASIQNLEIGKISEKLSYDYQANRYYYNNITSKLMLGLTGGPAAQNLQYWFHARVLKNADIVPEGWKYQIGGLNYQIVANYHLAYNFLWGSSKINESTKSRYFATLNKKIVPVKENSTFQVFNGIGGVRLNTGNWRNDIGINYRVNLFNLNMAANHFAGFDNASYTLFPGGMTHVRNKLIEKNRKLCCTISTLLTIGN